MDDCVAKVLRRSYIKYLNFSLFVTYFTLYFNFHSASGEVAREMFIIADGILEVISEQGRVLTTMKAGDFFGEIGILNLDGLNK